MKHEVEQKFRLRDPAAVAARLESLGIRFGDAVRQSDTYYNHPARDFAVTDEALRIRRIGSQNFVTYKGPKLDKTVKTRRELEQPLVDGDEAASQFAELLTALDFRRSAEVVKHRRSATLERDGVHFEVCWDEVERLGMFLELELVVGDGDLETAKARIGSLQRELELADVERRSYLEMILELSGSP